MGLPITLSEIAPRISAGAFILNSGLGKRGADEQAAAGMHGFAAGTYPFLKNVPPQQFAKVLSTSEIVIGAALLTPIVPTALAGAALTVFSGGLLGLYLRTPGMRKPGSLAPTEQGLAIGIGLMTLGTVDRPSRRIRKEAKKLAAADRRARAPRKRNVGG
jgi:hypothetical protein